MRQIIGLDIGYANVKVFTAGKRIIFPSVIGTGETSSSKISGTDSAMQIKYEDKTYNVGDSAIGGKSRFSERKETREWYMERDYKILFQAALSELGAPDDVVIVTGLPVAFYVKDKDAVKEIMQGVHHIYRVGRPVFSVNVEKCLVTPQPMGSLSDYGINDEGSINNSDVMGEVGIIDIGGKTTNILHASKMSDVVPSTNSFDIGGWDIVRALKERVSELYEFDDHEIADAIRNGSIFYRGAEINLEDELAEILDPVTDKIVAEALQLWSGAARLRTILISGGGANLIGYRIKAKIPHSNIKIMEDSTFANARGYYKMGLLWESKR